MTIFEHLDELRARLLRSGIAFLIGVAVCFAFTGPVLSYTIRNAETFVVRGGTHIEIIGGAPLAALFQFMEMDMILALVVSGPIILYQAVAFVMPALTRQERRTLFSYLPASMVLLAAGLGFGLFVFQPVVMRVATTFLVWVQPIYTIQEWVGFVVRYSMYFALLYQLPVVVGIAVRMGLVTPTALAKGRRWAFMGCLVLALMFAPPADFIVTPSLIVGPLYGLYELSILVGRFVYRQRLRAEGQA
jgi:sec-independent protein translocase protein TatC